MPDTRYTFSLLRAGEFRLDGGSMFGLIPRVLWSKSTPTDDKGRITVQHNCLLLRAHTLPARAAKPEATPPFSTLLLEAGSGDKLDPKMRDIFALEDRSILTALAEHNTTPESIDAVVVSHLHFDHAGGLTRRPRPGEAPEFLFSAHADGGGGSSQFGGCCRTFPNARVFAQHREWTDALANRSVMTKTYFTDHLTPIADQLTRLDSPRPFPTGLTPERDESPRIPLELRMTELAPGANVFVFLVPGHTWGQQATLFKEPDPPHAKGRTIVFTPDVMPTAAHNGAAFSLAYDVEPYTSMVTRRWLLAEAAARKWVLCLDHEPGNPLFTVRENTKGWFDLIPEPV